MLACTRGVAENDFRVGDTCTVEPFGCTGGVELGWAGERTLPEPTTVPHGPVAFGSGDLAGSGTDQLFVGTNSSATRLDGDGWRRSTDIWTQPDDGSYVLPRIADLTGDGADDLILGLPGSDDGAGQVVIFPGPVREPVSWDHEPLELKGSSRAGASVSALDVDADGALDLVASDAGGRWVRFGPVVEGLPFGDPRDARLESTETAPMGSLSLHTDVTGDGVIDVVMEVHAGLGNACDASRPQLRVLPGPLAAGTWHPEHATIYLEPPEAWTWDLLQVTDVNADGHADVLVWGNLHEGSQHVWVYPGPVSHGDAPAWRFASFGTPGPVADFDGDGHADMLERDVTLWDFLQEPDTGALRQLAVAGVLAGPLDSQPEAYPDCRHTLREVWLQESASSLNEAFWWGDLDGDGRTDAAFATTGGDDQGLVQLVLSSER